MRKLYAVSQLASELAVTARSIRFYEDKGLISPERAGATRVFTARDRARLILILRGKRLGFSLKEIRDWLDLYDADPSQTAQTRVLLEKIDKRTAQLESQKRDIEATLTELREIQRQATDHLSRTAETSKRKSKQ
ncbi:MerR family transcriptional regulator [Limibacillus halophilus]|uniref:DNA-binding transcriptional MerR regulator n=1 Tax=Limibacillus halophilus TaxID=1579333 RepID=A0A839SSU5_9PROT|nr:MerR family DNA-binding transcriptional regulator [Limibacillus halophilus]MBB3064075.1 DNA-binding transcriptional MerR regulator [Limibacillus halophilus]